MASDRPAMSEQTDPLAQAVFLAVERTHGGNIARLCSSVAEAIRAAVLADPTIVGMGPYVWEWPPLPGERHPTFVHRPHPDGIGTPLYRTPEVKG